MDHAEKTAASMAAVKRMEDGLAAGEMDMSPTYRRQSRVRRFRIRDDATGR